MQKEGEFLKRFRWDKKYLYWGITAFLVVVASILFYAFLTNINWVRSALGAVAKILSPFIWGLVIAYLLYPLMNLLQKSLFAPLSAWIFKTKKDKAAHLARGLAVFFSVIFLIVMVTAMIWLIGPRLVQSIERIVLNSSEYVKKVYMWIDRLLVDYPEVEAMLSSTFGNLSDGVVNWLQNSILPRITSVLTNVTSGVYYVVKGVYNILIGLIVSVYVLYNKEMFGGYVKKVLYCIFSVEASEKILNAVDFVDHVFIGFLSGKILDSAIIGIICYVVCLILKMPYALLVSFIVGLTNIIPFFGPFIGAVPSALIIVMESPLQCLIFIIFIIILQQFDGNILGPKILGNSVGVNGFWIMFSIILGAGLFGFAGMLLGVPVFVVLYTGLKFLVNRKLKRSGLPTDGEYYRNLQYIDPATGEAVRREESRRRRTAVKHPWLRKSGGSTAASGENTDMEKDDGKDADAPEAKDGDGGVSGEGKV